MNYFDFHNLLSPYDFEVLVRDILEVREQPLKFRTFHNGRDGGVDIKCTNSNLKIIGQVKLHNPNNFNQLKSSLAKEVAKVKALKPDRYILAVGSSLSALQYQQILELFEGYLKPTDILDREVINQCLNKDEFYPVLKNNTKLLVPNLAVLKDIISSTINKDIYNSSIRELQHINESLRLYHNTTTFSSSIDKLEKNRILIITGNPGVGKTTMARMIVNHMISTHKSEFNYVNEIDDINKILDVEKKQLFFIDDFWGQQFDHIPNRRNYFNNFIRQLYQISKSSNHFLILTSRNYIIKNVLNRADSELKNILGIHDFQIRMDSYSDEDKVRIFLNHLYHFDFDKEYFQKLKHGNELENIIKHDNYTPRHVEFFIKYIFNKDENNVYEFYRLFLRYLRKPDEFWSKLFYQQTHTAQLILIILLVSGDSMRIEDLKSSFVNMQSLAREKLNLDIHPLKFEEEIKILEELFIKTNGYENYILVHFQSPGIKDYLLNYLRDTVAQWAEVIIDGALFFNQLYFIFTTKEGDNISDDNSEHSVYGEKIVLPPQAQNSLKNRIIQSFHELNFSNSDEYFEDITFYDDAEDTRYIKLDMLFYLFNMQWNENTDLKNFVVNEVSTDIDSYKDGRNYVISQKSMDYFPGVFKLIKDDITIDPKFIISSYYSNISTTRAFQSFFEFNEMYPYEFKEFIDKNIKAIRINIREVIIDNIDEYMWNGSEWKIDSLIDFEIESVLKLYGMRLTKSFISEIESIADKEGVFALRKKKYKKQRSLKTKRENPLKKYKDNSFAKIINEYLEEGNIKVQNPKKIISNICTDSEIKKGLLSELRKNKSILNSFFDDIHSITSLIEFLTESHFCISNITKFEFLEVFINYFISKVTEIDKDDYLNFLKNIAFLEMRETEINLKIIEHFFKQHNLVYINPENCFPLLIYGGKYYTILNLDVRNYLVVQYINNLKSNEEYIDNIYELIQDEDSAKDIFVMLEHIDPHRLNLLIINPELEKLRNVFDRNNEADIVMAFLKYFEPTFELKLNKKNKSFEGDGCSCNNWFVQMLLNYKGIEIDVMNLDRYFTNDDYQNGKFINKKHYAHLYKSVLKTQNINRKMRFLDAEEHDYIEIDLYKFSSDVGNYLALKDVGMINYILSLVKQIRNVMEFNKKSFKSVI
jgi:DNA polymerase III delta prime subunit